MRAITTDSVRLSVGHTGERRKSGQTDPDAVLGHTQTGPGKPRISLERSGEFA